MPNDFPSTPSSSPHRASMSPAPNPATPPPSPSPRHESRWPFLLEALLVVLALLGLAAYTLGPRLKLHRQYAGQKTMVAMWALIAERPIADDILKQGTAFSAAPATPGTPATTSGTQVVRIDSAALFKILRGKAPDRKIHFCAPTLGWLVENSIGRRHNQFMPSITGSQNGMIPGDVYQNANINIHPNYQLELGLPEARLKFQASTTVYLNQNNRRYGGPNASFHGNSSWGVDGSLNPGQSAVGLVAIPSSASSRALVPAAPGFAREPRLIVVLQAVSADAALAPRLAAFADAERWLQGGMEGALESLHLVQVWEARTSSAAPKHGVITTSSGRYRIVGIGQPRRWQGCWWDADGDPVQGVPGWSKQYPDAPLAILVQYPRGVEGRIGMELTLDLGTGRKDSSNAIASSSDFGENVMMYAFANHDSGLSKETQAALERGAPLTLTVAEGTGAWEELGRIREGETKEYAGGRFTIKKVDQQRAPSSSWPGMVIVDGEYSFDPAFDVALLGVTKDSRRSAFRSGFGSIRGSRDSHWYEMIEMAKSEIESFAIMRRPLTRATVGAIASRPLILPDSLRPPRRAESTTTTLTRETQTSSTGTREVQTLTP